MVEGKIPNKAGKKKARGHDNGHRFVKGVSGNPKGRAPGSISLTEVIRRKLKELHPDGKRDAIEGLADNIIQDAMDSSDRMRELIWNYMDGKPTQAITGNIGITTDIASLLRQAMENKNGDRPKITDASDAD